MQSEHKFNSAALLADTPLCRSQTIEHVVHASKNGLRPTLKVHYRSPAVIRTPNALAPVVELATTRSGL